MRVGFTIQRLAVRRLRKEHRSDGRWRPPRRHLRRSYHDALRQDLRRHPKAKPTSQRAQKLCADRPARIKVRRAARWIAVGLVYRRKTYSLGSAVEQDRGF